MRTSLPLTFLLLAACASPGKPGVDPEWNEVQRHRLERLHQQRRVADAVVALLGRAPRDLSLVPQDPKPATAGRERHIDQILPAVAGAGPRRFRTARQPLTVQLGVGGGDVMVRSKNSLLDDRAGAAFVRAAVDTGHGVGVDAELWSSDDDLFEGVRINDGVAPRAADATLLGLDVFPHLRFDVAQRGAFSMPVRVGLFANWQTLDHETALVEREWLSLGPRLVLEPTLRVLGEAGGDRLDLVGRVGGDVGPAWFAEQYRGGDDYDVTSTWTGELGASLRGSLGRWQAELGYGLQHRTFGATDTDLFGEHSRTELQRQRAFLGVGVQF
ncbi:MAG: hypothetical protein JNL08_09485 [Planctomycetes bacterium]|nr:hypothetical protein [Planctomycetota bacterium]